jgi:hypothetical protein
MKFVAIFAILFNIVFFTACHYEPMIKPIPNPVDTTSNGGNNGTNSGIVCNADTAYFANDVLPILISNCAKSGCHDAISKADGVELTNYNTIWKEVKPFNAPDSKLYKYVTINDPDKIMPPLPNQKLNSVQLATISKWIQQGAKNNYCNTNISGCDTANVKYSTYIKPLLDKNCNGCHSGANPSANISLSTYANVKIHVNSNALYGSISHDPNYAAMPKGTAKLSNCDLNKVNAWIKAGALNN